MAAQSSQQASSTETSKTKAEAEEFVEYVGSANVREITAAQWKSAGVENQEKVVWDRKNRKRVEVSKLSDDALEVLRSDSGFKLPKPKS